MKQSISVSKGKGSLRHNNRTIVTNNVDHDRTHLNVTYKKESLEKAYEKLFGEAVAKYNAKQKRKDRVIENYMDHIRKSKNGEKLFYETIVQVGNKYTCGVLSENASVAQKVLDKYMKDFQERNPNLYVFNAVLHMDEPDGTPHLHIDWIPVATNYKTGMEVRNSLDKALKQQGIDGELSKRGNSTQNWQEAEKNVVEEIMHEHGWERAAESGLHLEKRSIGQYKAEMREIENRVQNMPDHIDEKRKQAVPLNKDKVIVYKSDLENLEQRARLSIVHEEAAKGLEEKMMSKVDQQIDFNQNHLVLMSRQMEQVLKEKDYYIKKSNEAEHARAAAEQQRRQYEQKYNQQLDLNQIYEQLRVEHRDLSIDNHQLRNENWSLRRQISDLQAEFKEKLSKSIDEAKKPLQSQIEALKEKIDTMAQGQNSILRAIKYVIERFAGEVTSAILGATLKTGQEWLKEDGYPQYSEPKAVLPDKIAEKVEMQLTFKNGKYGKGLYSRNDLCVMNANSITEAREKFPNCKIKNAPTHEHVQ